MYFLSVSGNFKWIKNKCRLLQLFKATIYFTAGQTSILFLSTVVSLVDLRAYKPYTLVGPPSYDPLAVYSSTTDYVFIFLRVLFRAAIFAILIS